MRIFNATNSTMSLPFSKNERITISAKSPSKELMCSSEFLSLLITTYTTEQIAIIVSGPFEIGAITNIPTIVNYVVQSLDEAINRFNIISDEKKEADTCTTCKDSTCDCESKCENCSCDEAESATTTECGCKKKK